MKLAELCSYLNNSIPLAFQESYDNSGLQVGDPDRNITSALITLDVTDEVIGEAFAGGIDLIISHHPLIFSPIKSLTGKSSAEKLVIKAVRNDIAIYSAHTNLDVIENGISRKIAEMLSLQKIKVLSALQGRLLKLVTYIPETHFEKVSTAIFNAGAGVIGNYDYCGFSVSGTGSFRGNDSSNPFIGEKGVISHENEIRFETVMFSHIKNKVIQAMLEAHPYEEVAYDIYSLENDNIEIGFGCVGELNESMSENDFLVFISGIFNAKGIRYSKPSGRQVRKIAVCGGSGASLINQAIISGADAYITADLKYHNFLDADSRILLADIGHFESEICSINILYDLVIKKFPKFAVRFSKTNTNPINYL